MNTNPPPPSTAATVARALARAVAGRLGWLIGAPLLVLACGFLLLWWNLLLQRHALADVQARATATADARLVRRYFHIVPTDLDARPSHSSCDDVCRISLNSVAVFEFALPDGRRQQVEFAHWAHDWQHNTDFELGIPVLAAEFRIDPLFHAELRAERSAFDSGRTVWDRFWGPVDGAGHWLLRLREPVPIFVAPLRYDPTDPGVALLDLPLFRAAQASERGHLDTMVVGLLFFVGVFCVAVLYPAVKLMLLGASRRVAIGATLAICLALPWWAPHAERIAPWLSDHAGALARELKREFGNESLPGYLARPVTDTRHLRALTWHLVQSSQAPFLAGLDPSLPAGFDPLDHAGAFDALQASFDRQLQAMSSDAAGAVLQQLRHYQAETVWELFVPALLRIANDPQAPPSQRSDASDLLGFYASDWDLPDVDVFLYRHRLDNYARLREAPEPELRRFARSRLDEAEARVARQLRTH